MNNQQISYEQYLKSLPPERRSEIEQVWKVVRESIPAGYSEEITAEFLIFKVEDKWCIALANQKNYISLHLTPVYVFPELRAKLDASAKKLKGGKGCINFKRADELPLEVIGEIVGAVSAADYLEKVRKEKKTK